MKELYQGIKNMDNFANSLNSERPLKVAKETEKAVAVEINTVNAMGDEFTKLQWVPKSIISDNVIPFWFVKKNML